jgi:antitoxin (DNA-binding transcriptional repressor) of toxin-antitoxin stability system
MEYSVYEAKTNPSRLLQEACEGKEVIIACGKKPVARLVAFGAARRKRLPGMLKGQISYTPNAFDPLTDGELANLGFG